MTKRYPGGYITKTPPTVSTSSAPGIWTMEQQAAYQKAGTWPFGGPFNYIEDVFSTYLYTGNGSTQTITNGIDLSTYGGLTWMKSRSGALQNFLIDTTAQQVLYSNSTAAGGAGYYPTYFNPQSNGFYIDESAGWYVNTSGYTFTSWTFRKQPKFFDIVTWTGNGSARTIAHNLGSVPGCIMVKCLNTTFDWIVWHRSMAANNYNAFLNTTDAAGAYGVWSSTAPTSTAFSLTTSPYTNQNGSTYVAYIFAHNAGGFGSTNTDNVISCGSFTTDATYGNATINLGYEAQWVMIKRVDSAADWYVSDNMRGMPWNDYPSGVAGVKLSPNTTAAEVALWAGARPTGFSVSLAASATYIYIAIRRGPMKTPTSGTSVFDVQTSSGAAGTQITTAFPIDLVYALVRTAGEHDMLDRLRGISNTSAGSPTLDTTTTDFESSKNVIYNADQNVGFKIGSYFGGISNVFYNFRRAPGFFDEVCYTGTGSARTVNHNLGVVPELMIVKRRDSTGFWAVYSAATGAANVLELQSSAASTSGTAWNSTAPTASVFTVGNTIATGVSGGTYVAYLFASCPGVSKVGSYSGTGATQTISCGFAARFVLIKRTDSTGDWFVWDTARGMVAGTDPRLALNSTAAETNANWVYTNASGFQIVTTDATVNASGGSYIYLAIS